MKTYLKKIRNFYQVCRKEEDGKDRVICTVYRKNDADVIARMFELQNFTRENYCSGLT